MDWTARVAIICVTIVVLAAMAAGLHDCEKTDERKIECVRLNHTPDECKRLLSTNQNN